MRTSKLSTDKLIHRTPLENATIDTVAHDQEIKELEMRAFNLDSSTYDHLSQFKPVTAVEIARMANSTPYPHAKKAYQSLLREYERAIPYCPDVQMIASELGHIALKGSEKYINSKVNYYNETR